MTLLVQEQVALAAKVTLKTGGTARFFVTVETVEDLQEAVSFAQQKALPFFVLGGGSNLLVGDSGYEGLVVEMKLRGRTYEPIAETTVRCTVDCGEELDSFIAETVEKKLWGLENLSHIPGSVGATPVQNVGAYGVEVSDVIEEVTVFDAAAKKIIVMTNSDCNFSYRHSIFKENNNLIILSVTFLLSTIARPKISYGDLTTLDSVLVTPVAIREKIIQIRSEKFPDWHTVGTAGSFFKNPVITQTQAKALLLKYPDIPTYVAPENMVKISLGYILDKICGLKGFAVGPVRLYEKQALVLVAERGATTTDIKNFVKIVFEKVFSKTLIKISQEVTEI